MINRGTKDTMTKASPVVFVVDDDESVRKSLRRLIRSMGFGVVTFASAEDFLAYEPTASLGCIVLDIRMPGISGVELQKRIAGTHRDLPVVVITGHGDDETKRQALSAGAVAFLYKPFDDHALLEAIERALAIGEGAKSRRSPK